MELESTTEFNVKIHWEKEKINFGFESTDDFETFKAKLYSVTSVPPEKQKILFKGKVIKDDEQFKNLKIIKNSAFMLMGTAEGKGMDLENIEKKVFIEDLTPEEKAKYMKETFNEIIPFGIVNLGNTCYLNSSLQILRKILELKKGIEAKKNSGSLGESSSLVKGLAKVFEDLENTGKSITPYSFVNVFMNVFPQFNEKEKSGAFQQQDADECFQGILSTIEPALSTTEGSLIDDLFSFRIRYELKNSEFEDEEATSTVEIMRKLS